MSKKIKIKPMELLDKELLILINNNIDETNLKKRLNEIFIEKGMSASTVNEIFQDSNDKKAKKYVNLLNYYEKLNLIKGFNEYFPGLDLNAKEYFSERIIDEWKCLERKEIEEITEIKLENMNKIDDFTFVGKISYEYIINLFQQNKIKYQMNLQREPKYEDIGTCSIRIPNVDENAVGSILESMKEDKFESSLIILGDLMEEGSNDSGVVFCGEGDIGEIIVDKLLICDGNHRILACIRYMLEYHAKKGVYPKRYFPVIIVSGDKYRMQRIVKQSFLRAKEVSSEYLDAITTDDYNVFVDKIIEKSNTLNENVARTSKEMVAMNKLTTTRVIREAVEYLNIDVNNKRMVMFGTKNIADNIDVLMDFIKESNLSLNYYNLYGVYVYFGFMVNQHGNDLDYYVKLIDKLKELDKATIKKLKLGNKNYNLEELIKYFDVFEEM